MPSIFFAQSEQVISVNVNPDIKIQTIDGFGASDAWRAQFVGKNWPVEKRNKIADLLFSQEVDVDGNPKGIGLSLWRFYLSAGTAEQGESSGIGSPWRRGECFLNADGTYDWSKQQGQQWFLNAAKEKGVEKFLAFTNAAPVHLSKNGKGFASKDDIHFNVKPGYIGDYAEYLGTVIEHFGKEGIFFDYLSPINEPQWNWDDTSQEGTPAFNDEIYVLVKYLSSELSSRNLETKIVIGEAGTIGHAAMSMASLPVESLPKEFTTLSEDTKGRDDQAIFFFNENSPFFIGDLPNVEKTISAHSYYSVWPVEQQVEYRHLVDNYIKQANPELGYWMSEYCILQENGETGKGNGRDLGMSTALYVARIIHNDLTLCDAKSWQWWTAMSQVDYKDGLVYLDDGSTGESGKMGGHIASLMNDGEVRDSKLLWVLGNYSRFIRPGMVRIKCELSEKQSIKNGLLASAYLNERNNDLVFVLTNLSEDDLTVDLGCAENVKVYTTSTTKSLELTLQNAKNIKLKARSVASIVL